MKIRFASAAMLVRLGMLFLLCTLSALYAQPPAAVPPLAPPVNPSGDPLLRGYVFRGIGPASMGGRIDDIAVVESNPSVYYLGVATGGVWKTVNNGTTFEPIFDTYATSSIGDLAVCQTDPNILWVGTGEPNNRQSSSWGDGVYKSTDGGKTFANMGLKETHTIARIVIDPKDPNTVYVAALGHLFGPNEERGIYKTTDGGNSWTSIKSVDQDTGFTDLAMDPVDSKILYAASYQRRRASWGYNGGGPGSGIWKTIDAGKSWTRLAGSGLPSGELGRIGLDVSRSNPNVVYAQIEVGFSAGTGGGAEPGFGGGGGGGRGGRGGQTPAAGQPGAPGTAADQPRQAQQTAPAADPTKSGVWRSEDKGKTWRIMSNNNNRPMYYSQIRIDPGNDQIIYTCGASFYKSLDAGKTFQVVQGIAHSDHHAVWIDPRNGSHLLIGTDGGLDVTYDQGATWEFINTIALAQMYAVGFDMQRPYYVCGGLQDNGSWCGPSAVRSAQGITNADWFRVGGGDGFYVQIDPTDHNTIYAESQNGAVSRLDLKTGRTQSIRPRAPSRPRQQPAAAAPGAEPSPDQPPGSGFGMLGGSITGNIVPAPPAGEIFRFNWSTPIHLSPHNPRIIYLGANRLFKSYDRGDTWIASQELSKQIIRDTLPIMGVAGDKPMISKHDGVANYGNITTLAESPIQPGLIWVGTDDGNIQISRDGGDTWINVADNITGIPKTHQISRVEPSAFAAGTCYASIDGHRNEDFKPYLFVTRDFGVTWTSLVNNLPAGNINVVTEDPRNKNLLYVGTEFGLYVSLNGGSEWKKFMTGLPTVRVDDIQVHPRDNDLVVGTHGRGIYILDDLTALQQINEKILSADAFLFEPREAVQWLQDTTRSRSIGGAKNYSGQNPQPGTALSYYLKADAAADVKITIFDITGKVLREITGSKAAGLNRVQWNLRGNPPQRQQGTGGRGGTEGQAAASSAFASGGGGFGGRFGGPASEAGVYLLKLNVDGKEFTTKVKIVEDSMDK